MLWQCGRGCQHIPASEKVDIGDIPKAKQMTLFEAVELDFEKNLLYSITFGTSRCDHYEDPDSGV